jgi:DNA polymerase III epsilon subunit-like protein
MQTYLVFDTETSGFQNSARVLEVGFIFIENDEIVDEWSQLFYPPDLNWASAEAVRATAVHGIKEEHVQGMPTFASKLDTIETFLLSALTWVGHNISFDIRMIKNEFTRCGREMPTRSVIDTLDHYRAHAKPGERNKLAEATARYGVHLAAAHTAVGDAMATAGLFLEMKKRGHIAAVATQEKKTADEIARLRLLNEARNLKW